MLSGILIESRARRQRRTGGVALSVAIHAAIIGGAALATAGITDAKPAPRIVVVKLEPPRPEPTKPQPRDPAPAQTSTTNTFKHIVIEGIPIPIDIPTTISTVIDLGPHIAADSIVIGGNPTGSHGTGLGRSLNLVDDGRDGDGMLSGSELMMRMVSTGKPRYPESLRQASIEGRVLIRFVVDTTGRIEPASVQVLSSTHDLFTRAVRDVMGSFRFKPTEVGGKRVRSLAEMPFEFSLGR